VTRWHGVYGSPEVGEKQGDEAEVLREVRREDLALGEEDSADVEREPAQHEG